MCTVCGCSADSSAESKTLVSDDAGLLHYGQGAARVSVPGLDQARTVSIEADILGSNNQAAQHNRAHFAAHGVLALNLLSSPGSGKTTLLCETIRALQQRNDAVPVAVIEGDQQTSVDADRIRQAGAPAVQVNTGKGCHLDAPMIHDAFNVLHASGFGGHHHTHSDHHHAHEPHHHAHAHESHTQSASLLLIENVGNLVCPALWDLGEANKVAILSVTEGEDKPLKYPDLFAASSLMIINKIDLLPYVDFDVERCIAAVRQVNPGIEVLQVSASKGTGMSEWLKWIDHALSHAAPHTSSRASPGASQSSTRHASAPPSASCQHESG